MPDTLTHRERIERLLTGDKVDRPPVSAWKHFYENELTAEGLAAEMLGFQNKYDWDIMKINPRACYYVEGWGVKYNYSGRPDEKPALKKYSVTTPDDLLKIDSLDPCAGCFGEQLKAVELIGRGLDGKLDYIQTVFSPLSIAADLTESNDAFIELMALGKNLDTALENITVTLEKYVELLIRTGVTGIFFATTEWATRDNITEEQYLKYGTPYDLKVLNKARVAKFNVLHVCKQYNMLPLFKDYPVDILSWNKYEPGNMDFTQADKIFDQVFLGGIDHINTLTGGTPDDIKNQAKQALSDAGNHPLILAPGCTIKIGTGDENLKALSYRK